MFLIWLGNGRLDVDLHVNLEEITAIPEFCFLGEKLSFCFFPWRSGVLVVGLERSKITWVLCTI